MDLKDTKGKVPLRDYTKLSSSSKSSDKKKDNYDYQHAKIHAKCLQCYPALEGEMEKRNVSNRFIKNGKNFRESMRIALFEKFIVGFTFNRKYNIMGDVEFPSVCCDYR